MKQVVNSVLELIGNTPLVKISKLPSSGSAMLLGKLESFNPGGSVKDRSALAMVEDAEARGRLNPGDTIVESTSGNTGIGLALVAAVKGYRLILTMPENVDFEHRRLLLGYGAEVVLTPAAEGIAGASGAAEELVARNPSYFMPRQFHNQANVELHRMNTAREILEATEGKVDAFVAGVGTGGTITGVGAALKQESPEVLVIAVEPARSPMLSEGRSGPHGIKGIGANFIPPLLNLDIIDKIVAVEDGDAYYTAAQLGLKEGLLVGVSAGANVFAALKVAEELGAGKVVVAMLPDGGERYLSLTLEAVGAAKGATANV